MYWRLRKIFTIYLLVGFLAHCAFAQGDKKGNGLILDDSLVDMQIVFGVGAFCSVLGLSTLSFVDVPGDHLKNIVYGASIGVIIGVGVVAWRQANRSRDNYWENASPGNDQQGYHSLDRLKWHYASFRKLPSSQLEQNQFINYSFTF